MKKLGMRLLEIFKKGDMILLALCAVASVFGIVMIYAATTGGLATLPATIAGAVITPLQTVVSRVSDAVGGFFQDLVLGVKSTLARYPKVTAAAMPPAVAVTPPVSAPSSPFCCTAFCVPIASE